MSQAGSPDADLRAAAVRFYKDAFGRGPRQVRVAVQGDLVVLLLSGVLTPAERTTLAGPDGWRARDALKAWHRELLETHRWRLEAGLADLLPARVQALHHDLSTANDECLIALRLAPAATEGGTAGGAAGRFGENFHASPVRTVDGRREVG